MAYIIIIIALIVIVFIRYNVVTNRNPELLQVCVSALSPVLLDEKNPILVTNNIIDPCELFRSVFKYRFLYVSHKKPNNRIVAKYLLIHNPQIADTYVDISTDNIKFTRIILRHGEVLIVPFLWYLRDCSIENRFYNLHDIYSGIRSII